MSLKLTDIYLTMFGFWFKPLSVVGFLRNYTYYCFQALLDIYIHLLFKGFNEKILLIFGSSGKKLTLSCWVSNYETEFLLEAYHPTVLHVAYHPTVLHVAYHHTVLHVAYHPTVLHVAYHPTVLHVAYHPTVLHVVLSLLSYCSPCSVKLIILLFSM